jgi:hypothetical protein
MQPRPRQRDRRQGDGDRRRALLGDLAAIARPSADEWARQQQIETLEKQMVDCVFGRLGKAL